MPVTSEIIHTYVSIYNINGHEVLSNNHNFCYICKPYLIYPIYDPLSIFLFDSHIWAFFANAYEVCTTIHKYFTFGSHICSLTSMTTPVFLV